MECKENKNPTRQELEIINDNLLNSMSLLRLLETDIAADTSDGIHYRAVKVIQRIVDKAQKDLAVIINSDLK